MDTQMILGLIARHSLTTFGGWLAGHGWLAADGVNAFVGAGMVFAGVGWSWWQKTGKTLVDTELAKRHRLTSALLLACLALLLAPNARAADMPVKAPAANAWLNGYPYGGSGVYFGIYTEGGGGAVNDTLPGVGSASLSTNSADVGGSIGYAWGNKAGTVFVAAEAMFGWTNFNGSQQGFSLNGPASFEQRFLVGTPLANFLSLLPNLNLGTVAPFPSLPNGQVVSNAHPYLMAALHEQDISVNFVGLASNREWRISPAIGIGMMGQLTNGVAIDAWIETIFPDKSVCVGPVVGACANLGQQVKAGLSFKY